MLYRGRELDVLSLWGEYVDLPAQIGHPLPTYLDKVVCPNPEHDTFKAHFQINTRRPLVHCFAHCGISGSYEHALCVILGLYAKHPDTEEGRRRARREAAKTVRRHTGVSLGGEVGTLAGRSGARKVVGADSEVANDERALAGGAFQFLPKPARAYLDARGISPSSRGKWQLGFDEDEDRLVIPALDERGRFRFLIKRSLAPGARMKYLYTKGAVKTSLLFGACYADRERVRSEGLILVEGSLDCIRLHQLGFRNAVAILGTGLSKQQLRIIDKLRPRRIYDFFDKDVSGFENILAVKSMAVKWPQYVCLYPRHRSDPAEMEGKEVERSIERALPVAKFLRKARDARLTTKEITYG